MRYDHQARRRRSIRLPHWDYSQTGAYFVTICTRDRDCLFGDERFRAIAEDVWASVVGLSDQPGEFIVMPNHVHGIIWITPATPTTPRAEQLPESHLVTELRYPRIAISGDPVAQPLRRGLHDGLDPGSLPVIVRTFKSAAAKRINSRRGTRGCVVCRTTITSTLLGTRRISIGFSNAFWTTPPSGQRIRTTRRTFDAQPP